MHSFSAKSKLIPMALIRNALIVLVSAAGVWSVTSCTSSPRDSQNNPEATAPSEAKPTSAADASGAAGATPAPRSWTGKMQALSKTLSELLPLVASKAKFNADENRERISQATKELRSLTHSLKRGEQPSQDPAMKAVSGLFEEDIERAIESLQAGQREYARAILSDTTSYCIQCHTQTNNGPEFPTLNLKIDTAQLSDLERAEFFAATRQFDRALDSYQKALSGNELASKDAFAWEQALRSALAISVRVKSDPKEALELLSSVRQRAAKTLPENSKKTLTSWIKSLEVWKKEKSPQPKTPNEMVARAINLIKTAQRGQDFPLDHSQDVRYFRAASLLHKALATLEPGDKGRATALFHAGLASEATRDMNFWTLHESYYEQCIIVAPHTPQAEKCFKRLKNSITLGYTGSSGIKIPPQINSRLASFSKLAMPAEPEPR